MTKELKSKRMKDMLAMGVRKAKHNPQLRPGDGSLTDLVHQTLKNGWHYQVEWIYDSRFAPEPRIVAYAFSPNHRGSATHYLAQEEKNERVVNKDR